MKIKLTQKRINLIYGISLVGLALYMLLATLYIFGYKDSIDASFWNGIQNQNSFRTQYQQHIEKYHAEEL